MAHTDLPLDFYLAAYDDDATAQEDWDDLKDLARQKVVTIEAMALVRRDAEGKIHVKDSATGTDLGVGAAAGAVVGALVGLIFPPALLASALAGGAIGVAGGAVVDQVTKHEIKADIEDTLPPDSSAIVAVFDEQWVAEVDKALAKAVKTQKHHVHDTVAADAPVPMKDQ